MKALVIEEPNKAVVKEVAYPKPSAGEVTVKVERVGICGTDTHIFKGEFISPYPIIPGHEFSGTVHEMGEGVSGWNIGDRVCVDPSLFCGECQYCLTGRGNQCENWGAIGDTVDGSMAEYVSVPQGNLVKMPDSMSFGVGAFIEPMACVVHAMNRLQPKVGDRVILFGAGAMGQQLIQSIAHAGASELVAVDVAKEKLDFALEMGATRGVVSQDIEAELGTERFDVVIDATGIPAVIQQAFEYMGPTAKYLQFGVTSGDEDVKINPFKIYNNDWTILGTMAINHTFIPAFEWVKAGRINLEPLITKTMSLEDLPEFFAHPPRENNFKVQIKI